MKGKIFEVIVLFLVLGCTQATEVNKSGPNRCFMVESITLGQITCRKIEWHVMNRADLIDCMSADGIKIGRVMNATGVINICE